MDAAPFLLLAEPKGFVYVSSNDNGLVIPPRFAIVTVSVDADTHGVRWLLVGPKQERTVALLEQATNENPDLENTNHGALKKWLTSD